MLYTKKGIFTNNIFYPENGEPFNCITYGILRDAANNKLGYYNFNTNIYCNLPVIFQFLEIDIT